MNQTVLNRVDLGGALRVLLVLLSALTMMGAGAVGSQRPREDAFADWSPDGARIVFASTRSGTYQIWTMNADGTDQRRLTRSTGDDISPSWSPDGESVVFVSNRDGNMEIYSIDIAGGAERRLTRTEGNESAPDWSPAGSRLVFAYTDDPDPGAIGRSARLIVAGSDGSGRTTLLDEGVQTYPRWSPDGLWLTFSGQMTGDDPYGVFIMESAGGNPRRVSGQGNAFNSFWNPDGESVVFVSGRDGTPRIYRAAVSGGEPERLTDNVVGWFQPRISPDGTTLLVRVGFGDAHRGIAAIGADGSTIRVLAGPEGGTVKLMTTRSDSGRLRPPAGSP